MSANRKYLISIHTSFFQKALLVCFGLGLLVVVEIILRLFGAFPVYKTDDPFLGFQGSRPLYVPAQLHGEQVVYMTNQNKQTFFNFQQFPAIKKSNTLRVFCFGGSTTYGRPFKAATAFPAWLQIYLEKSEPGRQHEVINAGGISYASYRVVRLMREIVNYQPDLFIVYTGHNEFLETITYSKMLNQPPALKSFVEMLDKTRLYRLTRKAVAIVRKRIKVKRNELSEEVETTLDRIGGFELYERNDLQKHRILDQFRINLNRMIDISNEAKVPILFIRPMSNLSDFSPFKSEPSSGIDSSTARKAAHLRQQATAAMRQGSFEPAKSLLQQAMRLDPEFAMAHYLYAQCMERLGQIENASHEYHTAIDYDVCPLRASSEIDTILEQVTQRRNVPLILVDSLFAAQCKNGLLGREMFMDHVHPTIKGHQFIARCILKTLLESHFISISHNPSNEEFADIQENVIGKLADNYFAIADLNLAKVLIWSRKHAEALEPLRQAAKALPENMEAQRLLANTYHRLGYYEDAGKEYQYILSMSPYDAPTWDNLCDVETHLGHLQKAVTAGKKATTLDQNRAQYYVTLGEAYLKAGHPDSALSEYKHAIRIDSTDANLQNNYGRVQFYIGNISVAMRAFKIAIRLNPNYALAYQNLGNCFAMRGDYNLAISAYQQNLQLSPFNLKSQNSLGFAFLKNEQLPEAINAFRKVIRFDSSFAEGYQNLGTAYTMSGRADSGLYYFEKALLFYPPGDYKSKAETLMGIGNAAVINGDIARAVDAWRKCLKIVPKNVVVLLNLSLALVELNKTDAAIKYLKKAYSLQPHDKKILIMLGNALIKAHRPKEAQYYYEKAGR